MILASGSPRRAELLSEEGLEFAVCPADIDETPLAGEDPVSYVQRLARGKAQAAYEAHPELAAGKTIVAADTIVWMRSEGGTAELLGKPIDTQDATRMLRELSGRWHHVTTGVCILADDREHTGMTVERWFSETTDVEFFELSDDEVAAYVATGEPLDKAGAYGIQGRGRRLVRGIKGDFYNVIGLPVARLMRQLESVHNDLQEARTEGLGECLALGIGSED